MHTYPVTLVTGDRVVLNALSNGKRTITVANSTAGRTTATLSPSFHAVEEHGDLYVWPADVGVYVGTLLDQELFNVSKLVRQGYADRMSSTIPVIIDYGSKPGTGALPGAVAKTRTLASIGAAAGREAKRHARAFGRALLRQLKLDKSRRLPSRRGPSAGVRKVYLDQKVKASLADSVPQIGAPQAWAGGFDGTGVDVAVVDTGIDSTRPDLAGKVIAAANFTTDPSTADGFGHGTHVASIVAGTGVASGGCAKAWRPGAHLLNA